jgi:chorismate synthase
MNSFGTLFRVQIWGESHQKAVGVLMDGCPAGISMDLADFDIDLQRRKSGAKGTTPRREADKPDIISGYHEGYTTGAPIMIRFENSNTRSQHYNFRQHPRPGHADYTADKKYAGFNDERGGGHFSGRLTVGLVAAGVIAKKIIGQVNITAQITEVGGSSDIRTAVDKALKARDSAGGVIECRAQGLPAGWGEPFFHSVESLISQAVFSVPGVKGIEFGSGFEAAKMFGSEHNDRLINAEGKTKSNHSGGINGGITNGNELIFRVAVKPTASIFIEQKTYNFAEEQIKELQIKGRHDACIALRMPVIIEAVTAIVLADLKLRQDAKN